MLGDLSGLLVLLPAVLISMTFHECAHAWMANRLGDPTARLSGRLTLDPLAHISPIGLLMLVVARFGWAKPVPVNPLNFRRPRQGMVYVSLAGPVANLILATVTCVVGVVNAKYGWVQAAFWSDFVNTMFMLNLGLAAFNLIPIPPLDGSKILAGILPDSGAAFVWRIEPYGQYILIALIVTRAIDLILTPIMTGLGTVILAVVTGLLSFL